MLPPNHIRHVLIDFENVPQTSLAPLVGMEVQITLLLGEKNKKLEVALVEHLLAASPRAQVIRVGASGKNALDLTLAYYLGRAAISSPATHYFIVSKDTDYDAMIRHARATGLHVERCESVDSLPFLRTAKSPASVAPERPAPQLTVPPVLDSRLPDIANHLRDHTQNRPGTRKKLHSFIRTHLKKEEPSEARVTGIIGQLEAEGLLKFSDKDKVNYA